jgi:hypothetical protein
MRADDKLRASLQFGRSAYIIIQYILSKAKL